MFGATRAVGRQPYAPAAFTPGECTIYRTVLNLQHVHYILLAEVQ